MPERPFDGFREPIAARFPLSEGHPLLEDEDALAAALLRDALSSVEERMEAVEVDPPRDGISPIRWFTQFGRNLQSLAAAWIPGEPEIALQGRDVRNAPAGDSESGMDGAGSRDRNSKEHGTRIEGAKHPPEGEARP